MNHPRRSYSLSSFVGKVADSIRLIPSIMILAIPGGAQAVTVINDGFEADTHPTGFRSVAQSPGVPFIQPNAVNTGTASLAVDNSMGNPAGNKALAVISSSTTSSHILTSTLGGTISLTNVGDTLSLSFKIRLTNTPTSSASGFRFGIYSSNGTPSLTESSGLAASNDDSGYYSTIGVNFSPPAAGAVLFSESGNLDPILAGTDRTAITASGTGPSINDTLVHSINLNITLVNSTTMSLSLSFDGGPAITGTTTSLRTSFDGIAISNGFQETPTSYNIDDLLLTATNFSPIPEPSVACLWGLATLGWIARRRR